jgi:hypothetical protein
LQKPLIFFFSWILVLCISTGSLIYVFYDISQFKLKESAHECIKEHNGLSTIKIPAAQFNESDEIWINEELYDVSNFTVENDSVCISVYHDDKEEFLIKNIAASFETDEINISDHSTHVCKHRLNAPNSDRVLIHQSHTLLYRNRKVVFVCSHYIEYPSGRYTTVVKHPPKCYSVCSV